MRIIAAIDIMDGTCVRLAQATIHGEPLQKGAA